MRNIFSWVMVITVSVSMLAGCGFSGGNNEGNRGGGGFNARGGGLNRPERPQFKIPVTVTQIKRQRMYAYTQEVGSIVPVKQVEIKPEIQGRIYFTQRWVEGDEVKKGQIYANMDDRELQINLRDAELTLEKAVAAVRPASAQLEQAFKDEGFSKRMFERDAISKQEYDQAILARIQRENGYSESLKNVETAQMQVNKIEQDMEKIPIIIPFDGVLLPAEESLSSGQSSDSSAIDLTLQNGQTVSASALLCRLANIDQVYAALDVPAKDLLEIQIGQEVELDIFSKVGTKYKGVVHDISTALNRGTRTYTVNVLIENKEHELRPGMFVTSNIITDEKLDSISIPREIIQVRNNEEIVFVAKKKEIPEQLERGGGFGRNRDNKSEQGIESASQPKEIASGEKTAYAADEASKQDTKTEGSPDEQKESNRDSKRNGDQDKANQDEDSQDEAGNDPEAGDGVEQSEEVEKEPEIEMIVEKRVISRGIENRDFVEVVNGLREDELLVIIGYETLTDGVDVSVIYDTDETMDVLSSSN